MGTYTQPSQVLNKAHSQIQEGFTSLTSTIQDQIDANRKEKKKELAAIEKQKKLNELRQVDIEELKQKQAGAGLNVVHSVGAEEQGFFNVKGNDGKIVKINKDDYNKIIQADTTPDKTLSDEEIKAANLTPEQLALTTDVNIFDIDEDDIGGIQFDIESDINFLYQKLGVLDYGSTEYKLTKLRLEGILEQAPVLVGLLNQTTQENKSAWNMDGSVKNTTETSNPDIEGLLLDDGKDNFGLRVEAAQHIIFGTKQGRFEYHSWGDATKFKDDSTYITYTSPDKGVLRLSYSEYKDLVEQGGGLIGTTSKAPYEELIKAMWTMNKNVYDNLIKTTKDVNIENETENDKQKRVSRTIKQFDNANAALEVGIRDFVRKGGVQGFEYSKKNSIPGYNYLQNIWQMAGGKGFYNPEENPEQEDELIQLLTNVVKRRYGDEGTKITSYNVTTKDYEEGKLNAGQRAALRVAQQDGIEFRSHGKDADGLDGTIRTALKLSPDAISFDLKDVYENFNSISGDLTMMAKILNAVNTRGQGTQDFYTGADIIDGKLAGDDYNYNDIKRDQLYKKDGSGYITAGDIDNAGKFQTLILDQINKAKSKGVTYNKPSSEYLQELVKQFK